MMKNSHLAIHISRFKRVFTTFLIYFTVSIYAQAYAQDSALTVAQTFITNRDWIAAEAILLPLSKSQPNNPFVSYEMAQVYENSGRVDMAKQIYQNIIAMPDAAQRQYTVIVRSRNASQMSSLAGLSQAKLSALNAQTAQPPIKPIAPVVSKDIEPKPTPPRSTPEATQAGNGNADVIFAMQKWTTAWANKDLTTYFSSYVSNYHGDEANPVDWKKRRTTLINSKQSISIELTDIQFTPLSVTKIQMSFKQTYISNTFKDVTNKNLTWAKSGNVWLIEREVADTSSQK